QLVAGIGVELQLGAGAGGAGVEPDALQFRGVRKVPGHRGQQGHDEQDLLETGPLDAHGPDSSIMLAPLQAIFPFVIRDLAQLPLAPIQERPATGDSAPRRPASGGPPRWPPRAGPSVPRPPGPGTRPGPPPAARRRPAPAIRPATVRPRRYRPDRGTPAPRERRSGRGPSAAP